MLDRNQRAWVSKLAQGRDAELSRAAGSRADDRPRPQDIVITREARHPSVRYTIGRVDKHAQLSCEGRDKALRMARAFAARHRVAIWENVAGRLTNIAPRGYGAS